MDIEVKTITEDLTLFHNGSALLRTNIAHDLELSSPNEGPLLLSFLLSDSLPKDDSISKKLQKDTLYRDIEIAGGHEMTIVFYEKLQLIPGIYGERMNAGDISNRELHIDYLIEKFEDRDVWLLHYWLYIGDELNPGKDG